MRKFIELLATDQTKGQNLLQECLYLLLDLAQANQGFLAFLQDSCRNYKIAAASKSEQIGVQKNVAPRTIIDHICRTKEAVLITNVAQDQRIQAPEPQNKDYSLLCLPVLNQAGKLLGILNATGSKQSPEFLNHQQQIVQNVLNFMSPFLERVQEETNSDIQTQPSLDILGEVLGAAPESTNNDHASLLEFPQVPPKRRQPEQLQPLSNTTKCKEAGIFSCSGPKKKSTYYLSPELFELLDRTKEQSKDMARKEEKSRITKTNIVNLALGILLKDFQAHRQDSLLIKKLLGNQD